MIQQGVMGIDDAYFTFKHFDLYELKITKLFWPIAVLNLHCTDRKKIQKCQNSKKK